MKLNEYKLKAWVNNLSPEELEKCAKECDNLLEYLDPKKKTEEIQLLSVTLNGFAIQYIKNPSEEIQLLSVRHNGFAIRHIENPTEAVQLAAVKQEASAIKYIENPSEAVQLASGRKPSWWNYW